MIAVIFILTILMFNGGLVLLFGRYKHIIRTDHDGLPIITKKEILVVAATFLFVGALLGVAAGVALFSNNPYWVLDVVFGAFT